MAKIFKFNYRKKDGSERQVHMFPLTQLGDRMQGIDLTVLPEEAKEHLFNVLELFDNTMTQMIKKHKAFREVIMSSIQGEIVIEETRG